MSHHVQRRGATGTTGVINKFYDAPFGWAHCYDAAGPNMSAAYSDGDPIPLSGGTWLAESSTYTYDIPRSGSGDPTYRSTLLNGQPAVEFVRTGVFLGSSGTVLSQTYSLVSVFKADDTNTQRPFSGSAADAANHLINTSGPVVQCSAGSLLGTGTATTNVHFVVSVHNGASSLIRVDGAETDTGNAGSNDFELDAIGSKDGGGSKFDGLIGAIGVYEGDITAEASFLDWEQAMLDLYLVDLPVFLGAPFAWEHAYDAAGPEMVSIYSDTDPVTGAWLDEVASFNPARAGGGTLTYNATDAGLNGQAAIDFDGTGYFESDIGVGLTQPVSVVTVHEADSTSGPAYVTNGVNTGSKHATGFDGSSFFRVYAGVNLRGDSATTSATLCVTVADGTDSLVREDGVTTNVGDAGTANLRPLAIGAASGGSDEWDGRVAAVGVYDGDITQEAGFAEWETDVMTHYGITNPVFDGIVERGTLATDASATAITVDLPDNLVNDDLLVLVVGFTDNDGTTNPPSGWTEQVFAPSSFGNDSTIIVCYRLVDGTEGSTVTYTLGGTPGVAPIMGYCLAVRGADTGTPITDSDTESADLGAANTWDSNDGLLSGVADDLAVHFTWSQIVNTGADELTEPVGSAELVDWFAGGSETFGLAVELLTGSPGVATWTAPNWDGVSSSRYNACTVIVDRQ